MWSWWWDSLGRLNEFAGPELAISKFDSDRAWMKHSKHRDLDGSGSRELG